MTGIGSSVRVDHAVVSGTFSLDGETFDVDNNIWVVGDDTECVVIDALSSLFPDDGFVAEESAADLLERGEAGLGHGCRSVDATGSMERWSDGG